MEKTTITPKSLLTRWLSSPTSSPLPVVLLGVLTEDALTMTHRVHVLSTRPGVRRSCQLSLELVIACDCLLFLFLTPVGMRLQSRILDAVAKIDVTSEKNESKGEPCFLQLSSTCRNVCAPVPLVRRICVVQSIFFFTFIAVLIHALHFVHESVTWPVSVNKGVFHILPSVLMTSVSSPPRAGPFIQRGILPHKYTIELSNPKMHMQGRDTTCMPGKGGGCVGDEAGCEKLGW